MWTIVGASVVGTSHVRTGTSCQDAHSWYQTDGLLAVCCSDGAGSAPFSKEGAEAATDGFIRAVIYFESCRTPYSPDSLVDSARDAVLLKAESMQVTPRDLACTLLGAIVTPSQSLFVQIGDGAIVFQSGEHYEVAISPMRGDHVNETRFLTDDPFADAVQSRSMSNPVERLALFTDGIERLVLNLSDVTPQAHAPFFDSLFRQFEASTDSLAFAASLEQFLMSASINERTDDDKTLVLARSPRTSAK